MFKFKVGPRTSDLTPEERQRKPLTWENAQALQERCPAVERVSAYLFPPHFNGPRLDKVRYKGNDSMNVDLGGTDESYAEGGQAEMERGRFVTGTDNSHHLPVVVIGSDMYKALFSNNEDPLGKSIEVNGHQFEVIGTMKRPANSFPGQRDNRVLLPYFTMKKMFPAAKDNMLIVVAKQGRMAAAEDEVRTVLRIERPRAVVQAG